MRSTLFQRLSVVALVALLVAIAGLSNLSASAKVNQQATMAATTSMMMSGTMMATTTTGLCPTNLAATVQKQMMAMMPSTMAAGTTMMPSTMMAATMAAGATMMPSTMMAATMAMPATAAMMPSTMMAATMAAGTTAAKPACYLVKLSGAEEVPGPGDADGVGYGAISVNPATNEITFEVAVSNITLPAAAMHIHVGAKGVAGAVVVPASRPPGADGLTVVTTTGVDALLVAQIIANPAGYYLNIHTSDFPNGALRGQLAAYTGMMTK